MILDFLMLSLLGGAVVAVVLILGRGGARPFRRALDRLAARRGWQVDDIAAQGGGPGGPDSDLTATRGRDRFALRLGAPGADWTVDLRESGRSQPGRSDITSFRRASFHAPTPIWDDGGWLVVLPALPAGRLGGVALGVLSGGRLPADRLLHDRLAGLLPEAGRAALAAAPPVPLDLPGLPPGHSAHAIGGPGPAPGPARDRLAQVLGAALATWPAARGVGPRAPAVTLGPDGLRLVQRLPIHGRPSPAMVVEQLVDGALALRGALTQG